MASRNVVLSIVLRRLANGDSELPVGILHICHFAVLKLTMEHQLVGMPDRLELGRDFGELLARNYQLTTIHTRKVFPYTVNRIRCVSDVQVIFYASVHISCAVYLSPNVNDVHSLTESVRLRLFILNFDEG